MLISRRREGEAIHIGDNIEIRIVSVRKKKVILGVIAPKDVKITSTKLSDAEIENTAAAANTVDLNELLHRGANREEPVLFVLDAAAAERTSETSDKSNGDAQ